MSFLNSIKSFKEVASRISFTFFIICLYRLAVFVPIPGVDLTAVSSFLEAKFNAKLFNIFNSFSGRALGQMSIMSLNLAPYISASIVLQLLTSSVPKFRELKKDGPSGQAKIRQYTRYLTLILVVLQSYSLSLFLEYNTGIDSPLVMYPGYFFRISTVLSLMGSTLLLMWFSEQITARGIGNGSSMLIFVNIISASFVGSLNFIGTVLSSKISLIYAIFYLALILFLLLVVVCFESVIRPVKVKLPQNRMMGSDHEMPVKLNVSGVLPPMFAQMFLGFILIGLDRLLSWKLLNLGDSYKAILYNDYLNILFKAAMIIFFAFVYSSMTFNPEEVADNLRKGGSYIPGIRPGEKTKQYFNKLINTLTVFGSIYLMSISIIPDFLLDKSSDIYINGTSLLIVVGVTLEFFTHVYSHINASKLKTGRFKR
ncbi:preprotein translocase subunit SecY [Candidatus Cytomitobacter indipagum]|uniref:Protein translocase subunit SecY n=1 Tax=Candidatus Cytomitobacter indipagum TaxID=2601575 RepID=A0A5C0UGN5_9PROT|nr:preprotein translocase subunit SecY [Candidatus Cytomitobacter indipagum]QEK38194.1 preprotein translocase subunit SecY [Candidatus Cytomitobacter indipagum]